MSTDQPETAELLPENLAEFKRRFSTLHDGLIRDVRVRTYLEKGHKPFSSYDVVITLVVMDGPYEKNEWSTLHLYIEDCTTFSFGRHRNHSFSVIFSFECAFIAGEFCFGVFTPPDGDAGPEYIDQFANNGSFVAGKRCFWHTSPYELWTFDNQRADIDTF